MKIQIHDIPAEGLTVDLDDASPDVSAVLAGLNEGGGAPQLAFHARIEREEAVILVEGRMTGELSINCSRCLESLPWSVDETFRFYLRRPLGADELSNGDELELSSESLDYGFLEGGEIDLPSLVQEQLVLAIPAQPLCRPDCRGICQRCGADLNREACGCTGEVEDPRFAVLKQLKLSS